MTKTAQAVLEDAMALSEADRAELVDSLIRSLEADADVTASEAPELSEAWKAEIGRRIERVKSGEAELVEWSELRGRIWTRLRGQA